MHHEGGGGPRTNDESCRSQNAMVAGSSSRPPTMSALAADGGAVRGLIRAAATPWPSASGVTQAAEGEPVGDGVEDETTHRDAVESGQQAAPPAQQPGHRVVVVGQRVRRRVERGPGTEGLPDDRQDVRSCLGSDPAYVQGHGPCSPSASEIRSSSSAVTCL